MSYTFLHKISQIFSLQYIRVLFLLLSLTSVGVILYPGFVRAELAPASQSNETHINPSITKIALFSSGDAESLSITPFGPNPVSLNSEVREITNQQAEDCVIYPIMIPNSKVSGQNFGNVITIPVTTIHDVPGHFGFVQWDSTALQSDQILEDDMQNPGNVTTNYVEPGSNPPDTKLDAANVNWIRANPGTHSAVVDELNGLINTVMPLPVWNDADCLVSGPGTCSNALGSGPTAKYRAFTFVQLLLTDVRFNGNSCGTPGQKCLVFRFLGFDTGAVDQCTPPDDSHSVSNLDIAMVLDTTGSMQFDTICYGCWERCDDVPPGELGTAPCLIANDVYQDYPLNGFAYPLDFDGLKETYICGNGGDCTTSPYITPGDPKPSGSNDYIILEAELYSNLVDSIWDPAFRGADVGYWALQRDGTRYSVPSEGGRSAYVRHHPFLAFNAGKPFGHAYTLADIQSG
ncbi:MAG: hypothetical protein GY796_15030, partial [Chloroflexi bacterium]|nr:hypothetical protein [Chloroflexota bacterium]